MQAVNCCVIMPYMSKRTQFFNHLGVIVSLCMISCLCLVVTLFLMRSLHTLYWQFLDLSMINLAQTLQSDVLNRVFMGLTQFGYWGVAAGTLILSLILVIKKKTSLLVIVIATMTISGIVGLSLKQFVHRDRPTMNPIVTETGYSFPSMHMLMATTLCLITSYVIFACSRSYLVTFFAQLLLYGLNFGIGYSRIYLGVHYFSDVIGGLVIGIGVVSFVLGVAKCVWVFQLTRSSSN